MSLKRHVSVAVLVGASGLVGCQTPGGGLAFWKSSPDTGLASSAPDVGKQKYEGLSQDFGSSKTPSQGSTAALGSTKPAASENWFSSTWNKTTGAVASAFTWSAAAKSDDPTRLDSESKKVGAEVYVSAGRLYENQGRFAEAEQQYLKAIQTTPTDLGAQVSLARLHDRQGQGPKALEIYQKLATTHPMNALVQNDLGLCLARQQQFPQSIAALEKATKLDSKNAKYRNNLAMILVETGRTEEALTQLTVNNPEAVAHYNLGILLQQKGRTDLAMQHLQQAVSLDGSLSPARDLLHQLAAGTFAAAPRQDVRVASQPVSSQLNIEYPQPVGPPQAAYQPGPAPGQPIFRPSAYYEGVPAGQPDAGAYRRAPTGGDPAPAFGTGVQSLPPTEG